MSNLERMAFWGICGLFVMLIGWSGWCRAELSRIDADMRAMDGMISAAAAREQAAVLLLTAEEPAVEEPAEEEPEKTDLGVFTVTAYCGCAKCCGKWADEHHTTATGTYAAEGRTVGADWATIPAGTVIEIEGMGTRIVEDKPAKWVIEKFDGKILDLYFEDHAAALEFGMRELRVWKENNDA